MSAYVVSDKHINALVSFLASNHFSANYYDREDVANDLRNKDTAQRFAQMLKEQCIKSVMIRYPQDTLETLPGPANLRLEIEYQPVYGMKPVEILKACDCYDYQSCEDPNYRLTESAHFVDAVRHCAIHRLPEYEDARGWDL